MDVPSITVSSLKLLDLYGNRIVDLPNKFAGLKGKLKILNLKNNPVKDKKLLKLINQNQSVKSIIEYVNAHASDNNEDTTKCDKVDKFDEFDGKRKIVLVATKGNEFKYEITYTNEDNEIPTEFNKIWTEKIDENQLLTFLMKRKSYY